MHAPKLPLDTLLYNENVIDSAILKVSRRLNCVMKTIEDPVVLTLLRGGAYYSAALTKLLVWPLELQYMQVSRYNLDSNIPEDLPQFTLPPEMVEGRAVLLLDDIYDEGVTINTVRNACLKAGATFICASTLLIRMRTPWHCPTWLIPALEYFHKDFLFGCGMDYKGYGRNLPSIYGVKM